MDKIAPHRHSTAAMPSHPPTQDMNSPPQPRHTVQHRLVHHSPRLPPSYPTKVAVLAA